MLTFRDLFFKVHSLLPTPTPPGTSVVHSARVPKGPRRMPEGAHSALHNQFMPPGHLLSAFCPLNSHAGPQNPELI